MLPLWVLCLFQLNFNGAFISDLHGWAYNFWLLACVCCRVAPAVHEWCFRSVPWIYLAHVYPLPALSHPLLVCGQLPFCAHQTTPICRCTSVELLCGSFLTAVYCVAWMCNWLACGRPWLQWFSESFARSLAPLLHRIVCVAAVQRAWDMLVLWSPSGVVVNLILAILHSTFDTHIHAPNVRCLSRCPRGMDIFCLGLPAKPCLS